MPRLMLAALCILLAALLLAATVAAVSFFRRARRLEQRDAAHRDRTRQLTARLTAIERRRGELEAVLSSMAEGVAVIDTDERLINLNPAAARLLSLDPRHAIGRPIQDTVRNATLQSLLAQARRPV
ncbi:MAG: PAS domain-containing protein, partial [Planctomycetota bacterium]